MTVQVVGGSGRRSMAENRNASAQSLKDDTFEGDSAVGSGSDITHRLEVGCVTRGEMGQPGLSAANAERIEAARRAGSSSGPK